jgi:hypothetical protein
MLPYPTGTSQWSGYVLMAIAPAGHTSYIDTDNIITGPTLPPGDLRLDGDLAIEEYGFPYTPYVTEYAYFACSFWTTGDEPDPYVNRGFLNFNDNTTQAGVPLNQMPKFDFAPVVYLSP